MSPLKGLGIVDSSYRSSCDARAAPYPAELRVFVAGRQKRASATVAEFLLGQNHFPLVGHATGLKRLNLLAARFSDSKRKRNESEFNESEFARPSPFEKWFSGLNAAAGPKVTVALTRLEAGNFFCVKGVGEGVLEYRIDWGPGYRIYFGRDGEVLVILLTGGTKKRQQRDVDDAKTIWADYKRRRSPR